MIDLTNLDKRTLRGGRVPRRDALTGPRAAQLAQELTGNEQLSPGAWRILEALREGVVLTDDQLYRIYRPSSGKYSAFKRAILRYYHLHLVDIGPTVLALREFGLPITPEAKLKTYGLGAVGIQVMALKWGSKIEPGLPPLELMTHDLLVNEIILRLGDYQHAQGNRLTWTGRRGARLMDGDIAVVEPDALIRVERQDGSCQVAIIEYHNEDNGRRGAEKVARYEDVQRRPELWREQWQVEAFPTVMVVYRHHATLEGYRRAIAESRRSLRTTFVAKSLTEVLSGSLDQWSVIE